MVGSAPAAPRLGVLALPAEAQAEALRAHVAA